MARRKLTAKVCRAKYRGAKLRACLLKVGARKEAREHPWSGKLSRRIARDHLRENPRAYGEHWLGDERLPDDALAGERIHGSLRPKVKPPFRAPIEAEHVVFRRGKAPVKLSVVTNRTRTRWWFEALFGEKPKADDPMAYLPSHHPDKHGLVYSFMADYATTTSPTVAQGWIAALKSKR